MLDERHKTFRIEVFIERSADAGHVPTPHERLNAARVRLLKGHGPLSLHKIQPHSLSNDWGPLPQTLASTSTSCQD